MREFAAIRRIPGRAALALVPVAFVLAGCNSRDAELAEKIARAEQAARDAEAAKQSIENAAKAASERQSRPAAVWEDPVPAPAAENPPAEGQPDQADVFDNVIADPAQESGAQSPT